MHYIHRLTPAQKSAAIAVFIGIPAAFLLFLLIVWGHSLGLFTQTATLRTVVASAQGIDTETPVTYSGMKIGRVTGIRLGKGEAVELTLTIERAYLGRLHADAVAVIASVNVLGIKEIRVSGGSESAPPVKDGATIASQGLFEMDNLMERVTPILNAAEKIVYRVEKILNGFPDERVNAAIGDVSAVIGAIRSGKSTAGKLLSTDNGEFYNRLDHLAGQLSLLSGRMNEAAKRLPETMDNVAVISGNVKTASGDWPGMQKDLIQVLKNLDKVLKNADHILLDVGEMTPAMKKTTGNLGVVAEDMSHASASVRRLLDDMETTLNETLTIIKGVKRSWPVKNMVPPDKEKKPVEPAARDTVYGGEE